VKQLSNIIRTTWTKFQILYIRVTQEAR